MAALVVRCLPRGLVKGVIPAHAYHHPMMAQVYLLLYNAFCVVTTVKNGCVTFAEHSDYLLQIQDYYKS